MTRLRIVARLNPVGIDRDVRLLTEALAPLAGAPAVSGYRSIAPWRRFVGRRDPEETVIFLERVVARWLGTAGRFVLIPNQERYPRRLLPLLRHVDHILCKSRHAQEIFARHHPSVQYVGFTSVDRRLDGVTPDFGRFFHLGGGSAVKGTETLLEVWRRHPEWPTLTVIHHRKGAGAQALPGNVELIDRYLPDEELRHVQNVCGVHLCPSLAEGWGHYIGEALSCGAVTLTTDAPPMNELVTAERGVLVPWSRSEPRKLGTDFHVDPDALEAAVARLVAMPVEEKAGLGAAGRRWFEGNDRAFRERLADVWGAVRA